jgi:acetyltransferase-like isoleucine patch superfamily enzyme
VKIERGIFNGEGLMIFSYVSIGENELVRLKELVTKDVANCMWAMGNGANLIESFKDLRSCAVNVQDLEGRHGGK